jgi:hypothetical protein
MTTTVDWHDCTRPGCAKRIPVRWGDFCTAHLPADRPRYVALYDLRAELGSIVVLDAVEALGIRPCTPGRSPLVTVEQAAQIHAHVAHR